jgi:putative tryptophan/tyrosine transport system substrate-binding protein
MTPIGTRRRSWLAGSLGIVATPLLAQVQPPAKVFRIGLLGSSSPASAEARHVWGGFFEGMRALGYVEGRDFVVEGRFYGAHADRLPAMAAELVALRVAVIVAGVPSAPEAAKRATTIRRVRGWWPAWRALAATSPARRSSARRCAANNWSC